LLATLPRTRFPITVRSLRAGEDIGDDPELPGPGAGERAGDGEERTGDPRTGEPSGTIMGGMPKSRSRRAPGASVHASVSSNPTSSNVMSDVPEEVAVCVEIADVRLSLSCSDAVGGSVLLDAYGAELAAGGGVLGRPPAAVGDRHGSSVCSSLSIENRLIEER